MAVSLFPLMKVNLIPSLRFIDLVEYLSTNIIRTLPQRFTLKLRGDPQMGKAHYS